MCDKIIFGKLIFSASPDEPETIVGLFIFKGLEFGWSNFTKHNNFFKFFIFYWTL